MKLVLLEAVINCSRRGSRQRQEAQSRKVGLGWSWLKGSGMSPLPPGIRPVGPPCAGDGCLKASSMAAGPPPTPALWAELWGRRQHWGRAGTQSRGVRREVGGSQPHADHRTAPVLLWPLPLGSLALWTQPWVALTAHTEVMGQSCTEICALFLQNSL